MGRVITCFRPVCWLNERERYALMIKEGWKNWDYITGEYDPQGNTPPSAIHAQGSIVLLPIEIQPVDAGRWLRGKTNKRETIPCFHV